MQRGLLADAVSIQREVLAYAAQEQELPSGLGAAVAAARRDVPAGLLPSPPAPGCPSARHTEAGHKTESVWAQSQKSPAGFCRAGWGRLRGVPREGTEVLPCPWLGEMLPRFQANVDSSCSFPGFNSHCTQCITGHHFPKMERGFFKIMVVPLSVSKESSTKLKPGEIFVEVVYLLTKYFPSK